MSFGKVPFDTDFSAIGNDYNSLNSVRHTSFNNLTSGVHKEHVALEEQQYGLAPNERIGNWAFGGDVSEASYSREERRYRRHLQQRAQSARRPSKMPPAEGQARAGVKTEPNHLAPAAGVLGYPMHLQGYQKGEVPKYAGKGPSWLNPWKDASGTSATPSFSASKIAAMWRGNNANYSGQVASLMNPPLTTQLTDTEAFAPFDTTYGRLHGPKDARDQVFERLHKTPIGKAHPALRHDRDAAYAADAGRTEYTPKHAHFASKPAARPHSAQPVPRSDYRPGTAAAAASPAAARRPASASAARKDGAPDATRQQQPQSAAVRTKRSGATTAPPWKAPDPYQNKYHGKTGPPSHHRGTNHFGKSIWTCKSNKERDIALCLSSAK